MKILANFIQTSTQLHVGKCYFIGLIAQADNGSDAYNIEASGNATAATKVGYAENGRGYVLPKPGVECTNGLYVTCQSDCMVYWSLG